MNPPPVRPDPEALLAHGDWLEHIARRLVGPAAAADLVQDTYLAALERSPRAAGPLGPWLHTVLWRLARDRRRGEASRRERQERAARAEAGADTAELVARAELHELLIRCLLELAEPYRSVLLLRYYERLTPAQIAARRGVPASTVRTQLERGLQRLRELLDGRVAGGREAWCGMLTGALGPSAVGAQAALLSGGISTGAIAMKAGAAALLGAALIGAVIYGVSGRGRDGALQPGASAVVVRAPLEGAGEAPEAPADAGPQGAPRVERQALGAAPPEAQDGQAPAAADTAILVRGRLADRDGNPLPAGELALLAPTSAQVRGTAGALGEVRLLVQGIERPLQGLLEASAPGRATQRMRVLLEPGKELPLGTLELGPGGGVVGSVRLPDGAPANGARVVAAHPSRDPSNADDLLRFGALHGATDVEARTDAAGEFRLTGVPAGPVRLWATSSGLGWSGSAALEVSAGGVAGPVHVELAAAGRQLIAGQVLDPQGQPVPSARIHYRVDTFQASMVSSAMADARGRFEIEVRQLVPHDLRATDPLERYNDGSATAVEPGTLDLELRLKEARRLRLLVRDPEGLPVEHFAVRATAREGRTSTALFTLEDAARPAGALDLRLPDVAFELAVEARGYRTTTLGPFEPEPVLEQLEVVLAPAPGLRGRVLAGAEPAAGVELELLQVIPEGYAYYTNGFRSRVEPWPEARATSDEHGRFRLDLRASGVFQLRARSADWAGAELAPRFYDAEHGAQGLELVLLRGGAIEGRVLVPSGSDPEGTVVALNHGDAAPFSLRAGPGGRFRVEGLLPGDWQVRGAESDLAPHIGLTSVGPAEVPWEPDCIVLDGHTTHFDLDLWDRTPLRFRGELGAPGLDLPSWSAWFEPTDEPNRRQVGATTLDALGRFEIEAAPGDYDLVLAGPVGPGGRLELRERIALAPDALGWSRALELARCQGRIDASAVLLPMRGTLTLAPAAGLLQGELRIDPALDGTFGPLVLPSGALKFALVPPSDARSAPRYASFELAAGELLELELP